MSPFFSNRNLKVMPLKIQSLNITFENQTFKFNKYFGILNYKENTNKNSAAIDYKVFKYLYKNNNPYILKKTIIESNSINKKCVIIYGFLLIKIVKYSFFLGKQFLYFRLNKFESSSESISYFRNFINKNEQNDLCLPRTFFAATTSKNFRENGVIFIGVFLPTKLMHAWIIESGELADQFDDIWINFQPVAAIYYV